ncbi:hypothetical protein Baya_8590 [Bagarius yarrelli]|uniref:Ig-like domain-containing protein n=1 Tax=Bagarius yarrelli TaxID=175774 RepID=A0A556U4D8_BAGYA|nr:hypothetical protein Baya_8590 [Bagarius yarrelli]
MKIHKYASILILSLFLSIEGMNITERSVQEGEKFILYLPNVDTSNISSVEWKQMERDKLLAYISLDNATNTVIFWQRSGLEFMANGSIVIQEVKEEDTGNYTCNIIFKDGKIQTNIISLTLYSGRFFC